MVLLRFLPNFNIMFFRPISRTTRPTIRNNRHNIIFLNRDLRSLFTRNRLPLYTTCSLRHNNRVFAICVQLLSTPLHVGLLTRQRRPRSTSIHKTTRVRRRVRRTTTLQRMLPTIQPRRQYHNVTMPIVPLRRRRQTIVRTIRPLRRLVPVRVLRLTQGRRSVRATLLTRLPRRLLTTIRTSATSHEVLLLRVVFPSTSLPLIMTRGHSVRL